MKRGFAWIIAVLLLLSVLGGCAAKPAEPVTVRLGGLKGPTSMGMVKLLSDAEQSETENTYEFEMAAAADELTPKLLKGELDVLAAPLNLCAILSANSDGAVQLLAINTLGVLSIVENGGEEIGSWDDLRGQTIYATGKGTTPEYALRYLLAQYGLDPDADVILEWKSEPSEVVAQLAALDHAVAMLPQPFVTAAKAQLPALRVAMDLTEEWDKLENGSRLLTAGLLVRREFAEAHPEAIAVFLKEYAASVDYLNENVAEGAALVEQYDIVKAAVAEQAIPFCHVVCITGEEMKTAASGYYQVLFDQNPASVGGAMPGDDFYYEAP